MLALVQDTRYDPNHIARFFDDYGEREWERFAGSAMDRVNLGVHIRLLREHVRAGDRVLDAGAGPGRFTLELARLGATVVAGDISPRQLELHAARTFDIEASVESRELLDILDLNGHVLVSVMSLLGAARAFLLRTSGAHRGVRLATRCLRHLRNRFLELEIEACREPGALDGGTHIAAVLERF